MKHCNLFIYYGTKIDKIDFDNLTNKLGMERFYQLVFSKGLTFRDFGEIGASGEYVVGKEIYWKMNEPMILDNINGELCIDDKNILLNVEEENNIRQKLLELDITMPPKYYFFYCWDNYEYKQ